MNMCQYEKFEKMAVHSRAVPVVAEAAGIEIAVRYQLHGMMILRSNKNNWTLC
jgi:hypothetical protein